jgi:hypothetical protein
VATTAPPAPGTARTARPAGSTPEPRRRDGDRAVAATGRPPAACGARGARPEVAS